MFIEKDLSNELFVFSFDSFMSLHHVIISSKQTAGIQIFAMSYYILIYNLSTNNIHPNEPLYQHILLKT